MIFESPTGLSRSAPRSCASRSAASWPGTTATSGLSHSGHTGDERQRDLAVCEHTGHIGDDDHPRAAARDVCDGNLHRLESRPGRGEREHRPAGPDRRHRPVHQVGRGVRLEQQPGQLANLQRDLERGAVVDPAGDHGAAVDGPKCVEGGDVAPRALDLRLDLLGGPAQLLERLCISGGRREDQRDRTERVDVRLGRGNRLLLARFELHHGVGREPERR